MNEFSNSTISDLCVIVAAQRAALNAMRDSVPLNKTADQFAKDYVRKMFTHKYQAQSSGSMAPPLQRLHAEAFRPGSQQAFEQTLDNLEAFGLAPTRKGASSLHDEYTEFMKAHDDRRRKQEEKRSVKREAPAATAPNKKQKTHDVAQA